MDFKELLNEFGAKIGGVELVPDENGVVALEVDGMPVTLMGLPEADQMAILGEVADPPPADRMERLYKALLQANYNFAGTAGATLSINPETNKVSLCKIVSLALVDADGLVAEVERFVNMLELWRKCVTDFRGAELESDDTSPGAEADATPSGDFVGLGGFMQV